MNIISNAVKYNKEKGVILLSYYETQVDDRHILFEFHCKDTGVGMSKEFQNHIFEPFTQETGGARSVYGGTGLGMPITKDRKSTRLNSSHREKSRMPSSA